MGADSLPAPEYFIDDVSTKGITSECPTTVTLLSYQLIYDVSEDMWVPIYTLYQNDGLYGSVQKEIN